MLLLTESAKRGNGALRGPWRRLGLGIALSLALASGALVWQLRAWLFSGNVHGVVAGQVYRSGQLSPERLDSLSERYGLRSVVNLRGDQPELTWYPAERQMAAERELDYYSLRLSAQRLPPPDDLARLLEILADAERPTLIHCLRGTDRSGLASALTMLLEGANIETARREFGLQHGYLAALSPSDLRDLLDLYESWLADLGLEHSAEQLHRFARDGYTPYFYDATIEALDPPAVLPARSVNTLSFRVTNTSPRPWKMTPYQQQGVHLALSVEPMGAQGGELRWHRGDTPERKLAPGESLVVPVELAPIERAGRYRVYVDMVDEWVAMFADMGSRPLELEIEVADADPAR